MVRNFYLSTRPKSSELLAKVDMLKDTLLFRDHPNLFYADEIAIAIVLVLRARDFLSVCLLFFIFILYTLCIRFQ